jgi:BirA family biotin operon repressor/biotin-[acetyl-CoA-carboxylase] ligase
MLDESARLVLAGTAFADVRWFAEVDSTNRVAADLVRQGTRRPFVVGADHQTAGRGRLGRRWQAPPASSLLVSVVWQPARLGDVHPATAAVAVAAATACAEVARVEPELKWPNDLVVGDDKLGGILGEIVRDGSDVSVIVGLGLNVNWHPPAVPPAPGVALNQLVGPVDRAALLVALLRHLDALHRSLATPDGPAPLLAQYRARSATIGRRVRVDLFATAVEGEALDVTDEGHLVVQEADGRRRVVAAGDVVHVRPAD